DHEEADRSHRYFTKLLLYKNYAVQCVLVNAPRTFPSALARLQRGRSYEVVPEDAVQLSVGDLGQPGRMATVTWTFRPAAGYPFFGQRSLAQSGQTGSFSVLYPRRPTLDAS